jgi:glycosyltransferase involved in cell wall biosynthesis
MSNIQKSRITVLMPVYNGEKYLREAIDSILNQTFTDFEFLIVDDGSTDNSVEIINSYQNSRINLVKNDKNEGLVYTLNRGLSLAKGEYIARMDCDDISLPERLKKQIDFLDSNSEIAVVGTWIKVINEKEEPQTTWQYPLKPLEIQWNLYFYCPLAHPSVMFRKRIILSNGSYSPEMTHAEDYELWWRLSKKYLLANLPDILLIYRQHQSSITNEHHQSHIQKASKINQIIIEDILAKRVHYDNTYDLFYQNNKTYQQAKNNSLLTYKIYQQFQQKHNLTTSENQYLKQEIGRAHV